MAVVFHNAADVCLEALRFVLGVLTGWLERRSAAIAYLIEETGSCDGSWGPDACA